MFRFQVLESVKVLLNWLLKGCMGVGLLLLLSGCNKLTKKEHPSLTASIQEIALGSRLFFDKNLSADGKRSCASCHNPEAAFAGTKATEAGVFGRMGQRSAPSLVNIGKHYKSLMWDGRFKTLEEQSRHSLLDSLELAADSTTLLTYIQTNTWYKKHFQTVYQTTQPGIDHITKAIAAFERTLESKHNHFDAVMAEKAVFSPEQARGYAIFFDTDSPLPDAECSHCHTDPLFTNLEFFNNGLEEAPTLNEFSDAGLGARTNRKYDRGLFKTPTLRNITLTAPYMHDGRFHTLEEVLEHYNKGGHYAPNTNPNVRPLHLSPQNKKDLIAFLHTLTDTVVVYPQEAEAQL